MKLLDFYEIKEERYRMMERAHFATLALLDVLWVGSGGRKEYPRVLQQVQGAGLGTPRVGAGTLDRIGLEFEVIDNLTGYLLSWRAGTLNWIGLEFEVNR